MRLSIAICTFNRLTYLKKAIESLLVSGFDPAQDEILIVDGDASDGMREYVTNIYADIRKVCSL